MNINNIPIVLKFEEVVESRRSTTRVNRLNNISYLLKVKNNRRIIGTYIVSLYNPNGSVNIKTPITQRDEEILFVVRNFLLCVQELGKTMYVNNNNTWFDDMYNFLDSIHTEDTTIPLEDLPNICERGFRKVTTSLKGVVTHYLNSLKRTNRELYDNLTSNEILPQEVIEYMSRYN